LVWGKAPSSQRDSLGSGDSYAALSPDDHPWGLRPPLRQHGRGGCGDHRGRVRPGQNGI